MFRSRVKLYSYTPPLMRRNLVLSALTKAGVPVSVTNYVPEEELVIDVPVSVMKHASSGHAAIAENGTDIIVYVADQPTAILKDFTDLDALNLRFVARGYGDDKGLYEGRTQDAADDAAVIEASDRLIIVNAFDVSTDKLEIGVGRSFQLEAADHCVGTVVVVDGEPIFLLPGILPAQMARALVQNH